MNSASMDSFQWNDALSCWGLNIGARVEAVEKARELVRLAYIER